MYTFKLCTGIIRHKILEKSIFSFRVFFLYSSFIFSVYHLHFHRLITHFYGDRQNNWICTACGWDSNECLRRVHLQTLGFGEICCVQESTSHVQLMVLNFLSKNHYLPFSLLAISPPVFEIYAHSFLVSFQTKAPSSCCKNKIKSHCKKIIKSSHLLQEHKTCDATPNEMQFPA